MRIRLAQDKDYIKIVDLHRATIRNINSKDYSPDIISVWVEKSKVSLFRESASEVKRWVAEEDGKIIGFCDHNFECSIGGLYIHKDFIGKGIGKILLKKAEDSMKKLGCKNIKIKSTITAKPFYEKSGYKIVKEGIFKIKDKKLKVFHMIKKLQ